MATIIRLNAGNDTNGNPRRIYVVFDTRGNMVDAVDEGYSGIQALRPKYPRLFTGVRAQFYPETFATTAGEYRRLLKRFATKGGK